MPPPKYFYLSLLFFFGSPRREHDSAGHRVEYSGACKRQSTARAPSVRPVYVSQRVAGLIGLFSSIHASCLMLLSTALNLLFHSFRATSKLADTTYSTQPIIGTSKIFSTVNILQPHRHPAMLFLAQWRRARQCDRVGAHRVSNLHSVDALEGLGGVDRNICLSFIATRRTPGLRLTVHLCSS